MRYFTRDEVSDALGIARQDLKLILNKYGIKFVRRVVQYAERSESGLICSARCREVISEAQLDIAKRRMGNGMSKN